jgi:hypothetical protein
MPLRGEIDDGETPEAQRYPGSGVDPNAIVIGAAVGDRPAHAKGYAL